MPTALRASPLRNPAPLFRVFVQLVPIENFCGAVAFELLLLLLRLRLPKGAAVLLGLLVFVGARLGLALLPQVDDLGHDVIALSIRYLQIYHPHHL